MSLSIKKFNSHFTQSRPLINALDTSGSSPQDYEKRFV